VRGESGFGTWRSRMASRSRVVLFLLFETVSSTCTGYVVSLELLERLQGFII
jgi:hypothetical protein